jgi:phage tail-like protein
LTIAISIGGGDAGNSFGGGPAAGSTGLSDPLLSFQFSVTIDGMDLGNWTKVELGGLEVHVEPLEEGGNQGFTYQLPGRIKYQNIKLTRVMDQSTAQVAAWFAGMAGTVTRSTGVIVAYDSQLNEALSWTFIGAIPVKWTLPSLGMDGPKAVTEVLEIAHEGFQG